MSKKLNLKGTGVAIATPFRKDKSIDFKSFGKLIEHVISNGIDYIVTLGTTGEASTLTTDEKNAVVSYMVEQVDKRIPVIAGLGGNSTQDVVSRLRKFEFEGVDAILSVAPYYNKPSQRGLFEHYQLISDESPVPVILYNVPSRTSSNIAAETVLKLACECKNIIAIKEASGNFDQVMHILRDKPDDFTVLSGDDLLALPLISLGAEGVISVIANAMPKQYAGLITAALKGDYKTAQQMQFRLLELINTLFVEGSPAGVKAALTELGLIQNYLRLPLVPVSSQTQKKIAQLMSEIS